MKENRTFKVCLKNLLYSLAMQYATSWKTLIATFTTVTTNLIITLII